VRVARCSGELASHQRLARYLVDGSGFEAASAGWDAQGLPFYSAGVAYEQKFSVAAPAGRYAVALPQWRGSVARVRVNGQLAGHISAPPWDCDVSRWVKSGENTIVVEVVGTLKNTLGPHHGNHALGSAWPSMFQKGPANGPPPGQQYATVSYGLFVPFELRQTTSK
jgi:hypothetical protein